MVSQNRNWISFKEIKTLPHALSLELKRYEHIKPALRELHWLTVESRIIFKVLRITFKIIHGLCPAYLSSLLQQFHSQRSSSSKLTVPTVNAVAYSERAFLFPHLYYGTVYLFLLKIQHLFHLLNLPSKHSCFDNFIFDLFYEEFYQLSFFI